MSIGRNPDQTIIEERLKMRAATAVFLAKDGTVNAIPRDVGKDAGETPAYNPRQLPHVR
jgi:hypothetical protein